MNTQNNKIELLPSKIYSIEEVVFRCPGCKENHIITTYGPGAAGWNGDKASPTFDKRLMVLGPYEMPGIPMRKCHFYVQDGKIEFLSGCTHELGGQTVEIPDWFSDPLYRSVRAFILHRLDVDGR